MRQMTLIFFPMLILVLSPVGPARGDEVLFQNGDRLSGKILKAAGGKLTIKTDGAGEVSVDMSKVKTFSTDAPVTVGVKVMVEDLMTGRKQHTCSAYLTFVALDTNGKPALIPPVVPETEDERRHYREAGERREYRLAMRNRAPTGPRA